MDHGLWGWPLKDQYILAYRKVLYVGHGIAAVAAETPEAACAGVEAIELELEQLPAVVNFCRREQGLLLQRGNPKQISEISDLAKPKIRIINRPLGTGDAVWQAREALAGYDGTLLILYGDTPLLPPLSDEVVAAGTLTVPAAAAGARWAPPSGSSMMWSMSPLRRFASAVRARASAAVRTRYASDPWTT